MPKRKNFILPGGCPASAELFIARAVVRRLEREVVALHRPPFTVHRPPSTIHHPLLVYLNRLSDYLYVLARYINFQEKIEEVVWKSID
jgi:cob(I)alamin adenosyltransferase